VKIAKWGNSFAVRLPVGTMEALEWQDGDEVDLSVVDGRELRLRRKLSPDEAIARLRELSKPFPPGFKFNREEANER
jgi:antitoxin MazE